MAVATERSFLRQAWDLAWPYWKSEEKGSAIGLLAAIVALTLIMVWLNVRFNYWYNDFYDALQQYQWSKFWWQFAIFGMLAAIVYRRWRLLRLSAGNTAYPLAALVDRALPGQLAGGPSLLPDAAGSDHDRQPRSAHRATISIVSPRKASTCRSVSCNAFVTLVSFLSILWTLSGRSDDPARWGCR